MKVIKKFQFTKKEVEALQTVKEMLQEVGDDDYETLLREIHCHSDFDDFFEDIYGLCKLAEQNIEKNPNPTSGQNFLAVRTQTFNV